MLNARTWQLDPLLRFMLRLVCCFCVGIFAGNLLLRLPGLGQAGTSRFTTFLVFTFSFHGAVLGLTHFFLREHGQRWSEAFGFRAPRLWHTVLLATAATVLALPATWLLGKGGAELMRLLHWQPEIQTPVEILRETSGPLSKAVFGIIAIAIAPLAEEVLFRGLLYGFIRQHGYPRAALWGTSTLFALTHLNAVTFVPLLVLAVILAFLCENTGNLLAPVLTHSLFNAVNFVCLVLDVPPLA